MTPEHQELLDKANIKTDAITLKLIESEQPLSASRAGRNMVFHSCDVLQFRPSYASCLMVMDQTAEGKNHLRPECELAIQSGTCPAVEMRKAELRAGRALFSVDYIELAAARKAQAEYDAEHSVIQFRRRDKNTKFVPTRTDELKPAVYDADDLRAAPKKYGTVVTKPAPVEEPDYNVNIMEQVVQKVLNDHS